MVSTHDLTLETSGGFAIENLTDRLHELVDQSGVSEGSALIFYRHTTGGIMLMEYEAGIMADLEAILESIAPEGYEYLHHLRGVDFNGHAHIRSALLGVSITLPISQGELLLGRYQQVIVIDMQTERAPRSVVIQISGE
jgi:secondary thiamine-phosphate synthase enzyme